MDPKSCKAACNGDIKHVQEITENLNLIVTPMNSTLLHVHIAFSHQPSTRFVERVLEICSPLLVQVNDYGDTPLHVAAKGGLVAMVEVLIKHAKSQHEDLEAQEAAVKQMLRMTNNDGNTALHEAAKNHGSADVVKLLLSEDCDFPYDYANNYGEIPLYIAASVGSLEVLVEMLRTCTSATYKYKGTNGLTILHAAVRRNHPGITTTILEKKYEIEANENGWSLTKEMDEHGWIPLHYAAYYGYLLIVELLVEFDVSAACIADRHRKMTALHLAAGQGYYNIIDKIIGSCPTCIEQVDDRGWNYVHFAMCNATAPFHLRRYNWPNYLLNAKDVKGNTPLLVLASISQYSLKLIMRKVTRKEFIEDTWQSIDDQEEKFDQLKNEVSELSKIDCKPYKRGVVDLRNNDLLKRFDSLETEREMYLVVAALIATVTFAAGLTLPGGYIQEGSDKGKAVLIKNLAFQVFVISDTIALGLSVSAVSFHVVWQFYKRKKYLVLILYAHLCTTWALLAMGIAFVTGIYAVLSTSLGLAILTVMVGLSFFIVFYLLIRRLGIRLGFSTDLKFLKAKFRTISSNTSHLIAK